MRALFWRVFYMEVVSILSAAVSWDMFLIFDDYFFLITGIVMTCTSVYGFHLCWVQWHFGPLDKIADYHFKQMKIATDTRDQMMWEHHYEQVGAIVDQMKKLNGSKPREEDLNEPS